MTSQSTLPLCACVATVLLLMFNGLGVIAVHTIHIRHKKTRCASSCRTICRCCMPMLC